MKLTDHDHQAVCFGESLWVVTEGGAEAGGSPVNIARNMKRLGMDPALITRVGIDDEGKRLIGFLEEDIIPTDYFQVDYEMPTGLIHYPNHHFRSNQKQQAWDNIAWDGSFEKFSGNAGLLVHGSLPARSEISRKTLYAFFEMMPRRVFNLDLHGPHYTRNVIAYCLNGAHILKLTVEELELITGWFAPLSSNADRVRVLQDAFHIPNILVSLPGQGCLLNAGGSIYEHEGFGGESINSFGSDDAFLAGFLYQFARNAPPEHAIEYACALQALVASSRSGCPMYDNEQVIQVINK